MKDGQVQRGSPEVHGWHAAVSQAAVSQPSQVMKIGQVQRGSPDVQAMPPATCCICPAASLRTVSRLRLSFLDSDVRFMECPFRPGECFDQPGSCVPLYKDSSASVKENLL